MNSINQNIILKNYFKILEEVNKHNATLVVVTKNISPEDIMILHEAGARDFGENRIQEWENKKNKLPSDIRWHIIGPLQSNKVKKVIHNVHLIHSIDREKILRLINEKCVALNKIMDCLLEIHIAEETTKRGFPPEEILNFYKERKWQQYPNLRICGLMGMATFTSDVSKITKEFKLLRNLLEEIRANYDPPEYFKHLSMGMSNDWQIALREGATIVRIGSAIFMNK